MPNWNSEIIIWNFEFIKWNRIYKETHFECLMEKISKKLSIWLTNLRILLLWMLTQCTYFEDAVFLDYIFTLYYKSIEDIPTNLGARDHMRTLSVFTQRYTITMHEYVPIFCTENRQY